MQITSPYMRNVFTPENYTELVNATLKKAELLKKELDFDTLAFTGNSGSAMAFILSHWMNVPMLMVRKPTTIIPSHNYRILEGNTEVRQYLIVDDFVATGSSLRYIVKSIRAERTTARCVGVLLYGDHDDKEYTYEEWPSPIKSYGSLPEGFTQT